MANKYIYGQYTASMNPLRAICPSGALLSQKTLVAKLAQLITPFPRTTDSLIVRFCSGKPEASIRIPPGKYSSVVDLLKAMKQETLSVTD